MKRKFTLAATVIMVVFVFILSACPPADSDNDVRVYEMDWPAQSGILDSAKWREILHDIGMQNNKVRLDLGNCTYDEGNTGGGLIKVVVSDYNSATGALIPAPNAGSQEYIAFDPFPGDPLPLFISAKGKIASIILPDAVRMVNQSAEYVKRENLEDDDEAGRNNSAFRYFTNLRSVSGANVTHIGNYAFIDCKALVEVDFPRVSHKVTNVELEDLDNFMSKGFRVDIGHYAFKGCTGLTEIVFNSAAVIGRHAFEGCTNLRKINFPNVWMIGENAFEGCTSLTQVRFEKATKIGDKSFKDCSSLKTAYFDANPERFTAGAPILVPPTDPPCTYDSMIFGPSAFSGCRALESLDVRYAWNVFFGEGALEKIGRNLDLYLFDDEGDPASFAPPDPSKNGISWGHPQTQNLLGTGTNVSLENIKLMVPDGAVHVIVSSSLDDNITKHIEITYGVGKIGFGKW